MMKTWREWMRVGVASAVLLGLMPTGLAWAQEDSAPKIEQPDSRYIRTVDNKEAGTIVMQSAARTFVREKDGKQVGPAITMCAAVHIGDKTFYSSLQSLLDAKDVVLFESVKPAGTGRAENDLPGGDTEKRKVQATKLRIRMLGIAARAQKLKTGAYPASVQDLLAGLTPKMRPYIEGITKDAWGRELVYARTVDEPATAEQEKRSGGEQEKAKPAGATAAKRPVMVRDHIEITSLGADGKPGGEGVNEDLLLSDQRPIKASEVPRQDTKGIQSDLAEAFGLVFQLDAMTHEHANWRNSDLSIDQVEERLAGGAGDDDDEGGGGDTEALFKMLDGSSMSAQLIKLVLNVVKWFPSMQLYGKVGLMEMLGRADELIKSVPGMEHMMDVIIKDRNAVVIGDVNRIIETEPNVKTLGIIYGGGHMPDLEKQLAALGYHEKSVEWLDAITVKQPTDAAGKQQLETIRQMVRESLDEQVEMMKKKKKEE
jgi:hypothetical protein